MLSAAQLLATGQRVAAALKSFSPTGKTPRSLGRTPSRPELIDALIQTEQRAREESATIQDVMAAETALATAATATSTGATSTT